MKAKNSLVNFYRSLRTLGKRFGYLDQIAGQEKGSEF
jgi:hypothetical protein